MEALQIVWFKRDLRIVDHRPLVVRAGDVVQALERDRRQFGIDGLWSYEETGNSWTYQRDKRAGCAAAMAGLNAGRFR